MCDSDDDDADVDALEVESQTDCFRSTGSLDILESGVFQFNQQVGHVHKCEFMCSECESEDSEECEYMCFECESEEEIAEYKYFDGSEKASSHPTDEPGSFGVEKSVEDAKIVIEYLINVDYQIISGSHPLVFHEESLGLHV